MLNITFNRIVIVIAIIIIPINSFAQDEYNKWVIGVSATAVDYFPVTEIPDNGNPDGFLNEFTNAEDHWNVFGPRLNVTRHWKGRISFDASLSLNRIEKIGEKIIDPTMYYAGDFHVQLAILNPESYFVPYLLAGGGYTSAIKGGGTGNFGVGANYWFTDALGFNAQGVYKYNSPDFSLMPHFYYSFGLVLKLNATPTGGGRSKRYKWNTRRKFMWRNGY